MSKKKFFSIIAIALLVFSFAFVSGGCGGSGGGGSFSNNNNGEIPTPEPSGYYTVTFNSNGGSYVPSQEVEAGETATLPDSPVRNGYIFVGWYTNNNFDEMFLFGEDGDKVNQNITLYAQWIEDNPDLFKVEYALNLISIKYSNGDNSKHVTKNVTLPVNSEVEGVNLSWESSNQSAISNQGYVNRLSNNSDVVMKVTASSGNVSQSREFNLRVMKAHTRARNDIVSKTVADIEGFNTSNDYFSVSYNSDRSKVTNIDGKYSDLTIENADDALDAIQAIHTVIGVDNPYEELESNVTNSNRYGSEYSFKQVYNGVKVYGRSIMASANESGEADFLNSSLLPSLVLANANLNASISKSQAEDIALNYYSGNFELDSDETEQVIYSIGEYETSPVYAYVVRISGTNDNNKYINEDIFVNAVNEEVFKTTTNIMNYTIDVGSGKAEQGHKVSFPVVHSMGSYYMWDFGSNIRIYEENMDKEVSHLTNFLWLDKHQNSAYANFREIMQWWKTSFDRDSLDGNRGVELKIITHQKTWRNDNGNIVKDNAAWDGGNQVFWICDRGNTSLYAYSPAATPDTLAHETTHAVLQYIVNGNFPYENATGAINEGYADIFGCIKDQNWILDERLYKSSSNIKYLRNVQTPDDPAADTQGPSRIGGTNYIDYTVNSDDYGGVHTNSFIISHAAYLMSESNTDISGGLTWEELGQVWYQSMSLGNYGATTEWLDVRRAVLNGARKTRLPAAKINVIKNAFDSVGITEPSGNGNLSGIVSDFETKNPIENAEIFVNNSATRIAATDSDGFFSAQLENGAYLLNVSKNNYVTFEARYNIEQNHDVSLYIELVHAGAGSVSGVITSATTGQPLEGVTLNIRPGWNIATNNIAVPAVITDSSGRYTFDLGNNGSGYYTIEMSMDGYTTSSFTVTVSGATTGRNGSISPVMENSNQYRAVLTWGENPSDLDSHLDGTLSDGSTYHVYYVERNGYDNQNNLVANLDVDDTTSYGPETVTFTVESDGKYEYHIHWYTGSGTWAASNATVNLYNGSNWIASYMVPATTTTDVCWNVFKIENNVLTEINTFTSTQHDGWGTHQAGSASVPRNAKRKVETE